MELLSIVNHHVLCLWFQILHILRNLHLKSGFFGLPTLLVPPQPFMDSGTPRVSCMCIQAGENQEHCLCPTICSSIGLPVFALATGRSLSLQTGLLLSNILDCPILTWMHLNDCLSQPPPFSCLYGSRGNEMWLLTISFSCLPHLYRIQLRSKAMVFFFSLGSSSYQFCPPQVTSSFFLNLDLKLN